MADDETPEQPATSSQPAPQPTTDPTEKPKENRAPTPVEPGAGGKAAKYPNLRPFKPGQCGNPKGRPKGRTPYERLALLLHRKAKKTKTMRSLCEKLELDPNNTDLMDLLLERTLLAALDGNTWTALQLTEKVQGVMDVSEHREHGEGSSHLPKVIRSPIRGPDPRLHSIHEAGEVGKELDESGECIETIQDGQGGGAQGENDDLKTPPPPSSSQESTQGDTPVVDTPISE